ncbi:MAG: hypothetical protein OXM55_00440 [Bdellovibrionales bacterium]|nr:hypothetical protein [Bdellovibrionales bacterium]
MTKQKKKNLENLEDFEKQVYDFYKKHNISFENPPTKTPEEYGRAIVEEINNQQDSKIKLAGTSQPGRFI